MLDPWQYAAKGSEFAHQTALFMWSNMAARFGANAANDPDSYTVKGWADHHRKTDCYCDDYRDLEWLFAIKNAGHGDAVRGAKSRAEGVKSGVPDLCFPIPRGDFFGLYVEMKKPKKGRVSEIQNKWHDMLRSNGYAVHVCHGWLEARDVLLIYLKGD